MEEMKKMSEESEIINIVNRITENQKSDTNKLNVYEQQTTSDDFR